MPAAPSSAVFPSVNAGLVNPSWRFIAALEAAAKDRDTVPLSLHAALCTYVRFLKAHELSVDHAIATVDEVLGKPQTLAETRFREIVSRLCIAEFKAGT